MMHSIHVTRVYRRPVTSAERPDASQNAEHLRVISGVEEDSGSEATEAPSSERPLSEFHQRWRELEARGAGKGDKLRLIFRYCHTMVYAVATRITGRPWDAEDITQSSFEELSKRLDKIRYPNAIPAFLKTTAVRMAMRSVKRERWSRDRLKIAFASSLDPVEPSPEAAATVRQLLTQLEPEERAAVVLKYVEMHSHGEVAALMGVSPATARRRLVAGRKRLVQLIGEDRVDDMFGAGGET